MILYAEENKTPGPTRRSCVVCGQKAGFNCYKCGADSVGPVHLCHLSHNRENRGLWDHCHRVRDRDYQFDTFIQYSNNVTYYKFILLSKIKYQTDVGTAKLYRKRRSIARDNHNEKNKRRRMSEPGRELKNR